MPLPSLRLDSKHWKGRIPLSVTGLDVASRFCCNINNYYYKLLSQGHAIIYGNSPSVRIFVLFCFKVSCSYLEFFL